MNLEMLLSIVQPQNGQEMANLGPTKSSSLETNESSFEDILMSLFAVDTDIAMNEEEQSDSEDPIAVLTEKTNEKDDGNDLTDMAQPYMIVAAVDGVDPVTVQLGAVENIDDKVVTDEASEKNVGQDVLDGLLDNEAKNLAGIADKKLGEIIREMPVQKDDESNESDILDEVNASAGEDKELDTTDSENAAKNEAMVEDTAKVAMISVPKGETVAERKHQADLPTEKTDEQDVSAVSGGTTAGNDQDDKMFSEQKTEAGNAPTSEKNDLRTEGKFDDALRTIVQEEHIEQAHEKGGESVVHVQEEKLVNGLVREVKVLTDQNGGTATIKLEPEYLGKIRIEVSVDKDEVKARFIAETQDAMDSLDEHLAELKDLLKGQELDLKDCKVVIDQDGTAERRRKGNERQDYRDLAFYLDNLVGEEKDDKPMAHRGARIVGGESRIDLVV